MSVVRSARPRWDAADRLRSAIARLAEPAEQVQLLLMPDVVRQDLVAHLWRCLPYEGVGVIGAQMTRTRTIATRFYPGRNQDPSPLRYTMDPADVVSALHDMERWGMRLGAIVHSHPDTPPVPSATDLAEASCPGVLSVIVGFSPEIELRAWQFIYGGDRIAVGSEAVPIEGLPNVWGDVARISNGSRRGLSERGSDHRKVGNGRAGGRVSAHGHERPGSAGTLQ